MNGRQNRLSITIIGQQKESVTRLVFPAGQIRVAWSTQFSFRRLNIGCDKAINKEWLILLGLISRPDMLNTPISASLKLKAWTRLRHLRNSSPYKGPRDRSSKNQSRGLHLSSTDKLLGGRPSGYWLSWISNWSRRPPCTAIFEILKRLLACAGATRELYAKYHFIERISSVKRYVTRFNQ